MATKDIEKITSEPNEEGKHSLRCPECLVDFLSTITKDDKSDAINDVHCPSCGHNDEPKLFIAAANQSAVNKLAMDHAVKELKKTFRGRLK